MGVMSACKGVLAISGELLLVFGCCCCRCRGPKISLTNTNSKHEPKFHNVVYLCLVSGLVCTMVCVFSMQRDSRNEFNVCFIKRNRFDDDRNIVDYLKTGMRLEMQSPYRIMHTSTHIHILITFPKIYNERNFAIH